MLLLWAGTMSWRRWLRSWSPGGSSFSYSLIIGLTPLMLQSLMTTPPLRKVPRPLSSMISLSCFQPDESSNFLILQRTHWQSCHQMSCCGVEGYKDFEKARPFMDQVETVSQIKLKLLDSQVAREGTGMVIPKSCCILKQDSNFLLIKPEVHTKKNWVHLLNIWQHYLTGSLLCEKSKGVKLFPIYG